ncbi:MAG TPA: tagaturonate epimerase family protein [Planctomycetota bacterium]|nr:tagaturonate epimerase family protein [Planctomycetota bacterium]
MNTAKENFRKPGAPAAFLKVPASTREQISSEFASAGGGKQQVYGASLCAVPGGLVAAAREGQQRKLLVAGDVKGFSGTAVQGIQICEANAANMAALRALVPFLKPVLTGMKPSVGLGDRLGLATPGHIAAGAGSGFVLVLAQQSIREMTRTGRTAQQVMDEAVFGIFQSGYDAGFGADADHLKTPADVDVTSAAGFTFFTIDPSAHVDDTVNSADERDLAARVEKMAAEGVKGAAEWKKKYLEREFKAGKHTFRFDALSLLRAAAKYGRAVAHTEMMAKYIATKAPQHELELSVDETALPTSPAEHLFIANELRERGVKLISLAPRFIGEFEKGIDYKGDQKAFEAALEEHAAIAEHYGPYKLSVHSGSDKFAVYPAVARITKGKFHLKTAGTSYLEALRAVVRTDKKFFREIVGFCRERFDTDKATYHISATLQKVKPATELADGELERVYLDENDGRQILHVTFGSVLLTNGSDGKPLFRQRLLELLNREAQLYVDVLKKHIGRHVSGLKQGM